MTREEFTERVGLNVSDGIFEVWNGVYMSSDKDKDEFCKPFATKKGHLDLSRSMVIEIAELKKKIRVQKESYDRQVELGHIKDGDKICQDKDTGAFGTKDGLAAFFKFYDDSRAAIPKECDPQEVYFYEYNNHECMIAWDGDKEAYDLIVGYWGEEVAKTIERL